MKYYAIYFLSFILVTFIFHSCAQHKNKTNKSEMETNSPKTIFLNFELSKNKDNSMALKLIDKMVVDGEIKKNNLAISNPKVGDFKCIELDERKNPIQHFYLSNPLDKRVEYVDDDGQLSSKNIKLETTTLSIRMQLHQQTHLIAMEQITDQSSKTESITVIKLN